LFGKTAANKTDITSDLSLLQDTSRLVRIKENSQQNKLISIYQQGCLNGQVEAS
jgi:hypothetical protein